MSVKKLTVHVDRADKQDVSSALNLEDIGLTSRYRRQSSGEARVLAPGYSRPEDTGRFCPNFGKLEFSCLRASKMDALAV
jgi:hypothetical protein